MTDFLDRLYLNSPVWMQQLMVAVYGWWWNRRRFGPESHRLREEFSSRDWWSDQQFGELQERMLARLFRVARRSPYYSKIFAQAGITPTTEPRVALTRMPLLTKETLRASSAELLTCKRLPWGTVSLKSSGTTGTPTDIRYTTEFHSVQMAVAAIRSFGWAGVPHDARRIMFGGRKVCRFDQTDPPFWRQSPVEDLAYASIYHLSPKNLPAYLTYLREFRPTIVMGYPSALNILARHALEHKDFPPPAEGVFTTSETLTGPVRDALQSVWKCGVFDRYGAVEGCFFASECEYRRLHVSPDVGIVEVLDRDGNPCPPGVLGEVVATGLWNRVQPLIRYRIGDAARWALDQNCPCTRQMPVLESVEGRVEDICRIADGRQMAWFDSVFKGINTIREAQVVQEAIDRFVIIVVPEPGFSDVDIRSLLENMRSHVGDAEIKVQCVSSIPRTPAGKFRAVICNLPSAAIRGQ
jgi:phenylacetate-CoA ligase